MQFKHFSNYLAGEDSFGPSYSEVVPEDPVDPCRSGLPGPVCYFPPDHSVAVAAVAVVVAAVVAAAAAVVAVAVVVAAAAGVHCSS